MKRVPAIYSALVAIAVSCHSEVTFAKSSVQEEITHSSALTSDGRVHIDNVNGKVHVSGWDRSEVKIVATKRADKQSDMDAVKVQIEASPDQVQIHTRYPKNNGFWKRSNSTKVDYEVKVPFGAKLDRVENVNGSVELEGIQGDVRASTVNGS